MWSGSSVSFTLRAARSNEHGLGRVLPQPECSDRRLAAGPCWHSPRRNYQQHPALKAYLTPGIAVGMKRMILAAREGGADACAESIIIPVYRIGDQIDRHLSHSISEGPAAAIFQGGALALRAFRIRSQPDSPVFKKLVVFATNHSHEPPAHT